MLKLNDIESRFIRENIIEEYGYLLPFLQNCDFYVIEVSAWDIIPGQPDYFNSLTEDDIEPYIGHQGIMGIVKQSDEHYRIIDGNHRIKANILLPKMKVILAK